MDKDSSSDRIDRARGRHILGEGQKTLVTIVVVVQRLPSTVQRKETHAIGSSVMKEPCANVDAAATDGEGSELRLYGA